ncbi:uncharacterized protein LOC117807623 isoform X2 [Notolabrus celidotus]|uniref:uncharacterized protein LOC117807623 isoform X2 n=1 Tax=Notolabrus celidotus TaxID=1203425 RepID=UPI00149063E3|nr:uncharacterized protein LOC117807623 isoform X2 [Notolabrus celidotus]
MISRFLLLMALSCCVCGTLVVNVTHTSYQAEENQDVTLEWIFTPKPDRSTQRLFVHCDMFTDHKNPTLFHLHEGVEVSESQDEEFSGRVQCDKDVLREGRIRLHVSSLRTNDSGWYRCEVKTKSGVSLARCHLNVTAVHEPEDQRPTERPEPGDQSRGMTALYVGLAVSLAALFLFLCVIRLCVFKSARYNNCRSAVMKTQRNRSGCKNIRVSSEPFIVPDVEGLRSNMEQGLWLRGGAGHPLTGLVV